MLIFGQKASYLGPTIFEIPQPKWHLYKLSQMIHAVKKCLVLRNGNYLWKQVFEIDVKLLKRDTVQVPRHSETNAHVKS